MNEISVKILPASSGDCILVKVSGLLILIDGGFVNTYNSFLKYELQKSRNVGLDYLIVTHIDQDHISGINKLLSENSDDAIIPIRNIWHNAYRHIQGITIDITKYQSVSGKTLDDISGLSYLKDESSDIKNISAEQGSTLAGMILKGGYAWNQAFQGKAVSVNNQNVVILNKDVKLILLSPDDDKLAELKKYWYKELYKKGYSVNDSEFYDDAFEFVMSVSKQRKKVVNKGVSAGVNLEELAAVNFDDDIEEPNGSSIAFILESKNFKGLFLGDAHPDIITANLTKYYSNQALPINFDFIKVAHHGVVFNNSHELLKIIDSERYIFSTNGSGYNHPDLETLARIVTRPASYIRNLYFNYDVAASKAIDLSELKEKFRYEVLTSDGNTIIEPFSL